MENHPAELLTVNAGSSSIKAAVFAATAGEPRRLARGEVTGIRKLASLVTADDGGHGTTVPLPAVRHDDAMAALLDWVRGAVGGRELAAVGHRIVHGGDRYTGPVVATPAVLDDLDRLAVLAPMHQPVALNAVRTLSRLLPDVPQVLSFDTA